MSAPETLEGWFALHDLRSLDRRAWESLSPQEREKAVGEARDMFGGTEDVTDSDAGRSTTYSIIGHKADLLMLHLRPDVAHLHNLERRFDQTMLGSCMSRAYSYLSVIEVSRHATHEGTAGNVEDSP